MATLQKIRDRGPLIAVVIGFALLAFILGMGSIGKSINNLFSSSSANALGIVDGEEIGIKEFQERYNNHKAFIQNANGLNSLTPDQERQLREETWNMMLNEILLVNKLKDMGLWVSDLEVSELILGDDRQRDPIMRQIAIFADQETRQFSPQAVRQFFNNINNNDVAREFGVYLEDLIRMNKAQTKFQTLITKGLHVSKAEAQQLYKERVETVDFNYAFKSYRTVKDETIKVSDEEVKNYYKKHKKDYDQEMSRDISYLAFDILPSEKDRNDVKATVNEFKKELKNIGAADEEGIINFVNINSDERFINKYYTKGGYKLPVIDSLIQEAAVGDIIGPFEQDGFYKLAFIEKKVNVPDTVQASHILIAPDGAKIANMQDAKALIDSLETAIKSGSDFAAVAKQYSMDTGSGKKGGDLGKFTESQMVKPFSDACFFGNVGDLKKVESRYGWHLIKITDQTKKKEKVFPIIFSRKILPGEETLKDNYNKAAAFASVVNSRESFEKEAQKLGLTPGIATDLNPNTRVIAGIENPESIISWTFRDKTNKNSVSEVFQNNNKFVVAIVTEVREKGIAPLEQVKDLIMPEVIKEKKAEMFTKEFTTAMQGNTDLKVVAEKASAQFSSQRNVAFSSSAIPGIGAEPKVIGTLLSLPKDKLSAPLKGENGVYVVQVTNKSPEAKVSEAEVEKDLLNTNRNMTFRVSRSLVQALKERSEIEDFRYKFF